MINNCLAPSSLPFFPRQSPAIPSLNGGANVRAQADQGMHGNPHGKRRAFQSTSHFFQQRGWLPKPVPALNRMLRIDTDIAGFRTSPEMEKRYLGQLHSDLDKWLERKLEERLEQVPELRKIPEANLKAVLEYTMGFGAVNYAHMNAALRNGNRDDILEYEPYILNLISALNQFPVFNGLVYRGIRAPSAKILEKYLENGTIMENGFTSATADKAYAFPGNVLFLIKNGGPDIGLISCAPHEKEILIRPGTRFFVSGVRREDSDPLHDAPHEVRPHLTISLTRRS